MSRSAPLWRGVAAGVAGTVAEALWNRAENRLLGRRPVFDTTVMAGRLLQRAGIDGSDRFAAPLGTVMRATYGPSWGLPAAVLWRRCHGSAAGAVALAAAIWGFELVALPRSGATPPLRDWGRGELALDASNALLFSAVTWAVLTW